MSRDRKQLRFDWERILRRIRLPTSVKVVGFTAAQYGNIDGTSIRPGEDVLAAVTGLGESTVRAALKQLRELQLLVRVSRGSSYGRQARADVYRLAIPADLLDILAAHDIELLPPDELPVDRAPKHPRPSRRKPRATVASVDQADAESPVDNTGSPPAAGGDRDRTPPGDSGDHPGTPLAAGRNTASCWPLPEHGPPIEKPHHNWLSTTVTLPTRSAPVDKSTVDNASAPRPRRRRGPDRPPGARRRAATRPSGSARRPQRRGPERARRRRGGRLSGWLRSALRRASRRHHRGDPPAARTVAP